MFQKGRNRDDRVYVARHALGALQGVYNSDHQGCGFFAAR